MSIWDSVDRNKFESGIKKLHDIAPTQNPLALTSPDASKHVEGSKRKSEEYTLPLAVEKQVCDDLAFLAAWESSPDCVTAASLQESDNADSMTISLAANEDISVEVTKVFDEMFTLLKACAERASRVDCVSQCLNLTLPLHRRRIRQRLGLKLDKVSSRKPSSAQNFVSITLRLGKMLEDVPKTDCGEARASMVVAISALKDAIGEVEKGDANDLEHITNVVKIASTISKRNESLTQRLKAAGYGAYVQRNEIRQIKAIANYYHCCSYLCNVSRTYRTVFKSITLNTIPAYPVEKWPKLAGIKQAKHFVHAEIQLLVHHEMNTATRPPRYIGVSKRNCFLCYCFMRGYGTYTGIESHGELHVQWTVPDRRDYSKDSRRRLSNALLSTKKDVDAALIRARAENKRLAPQLQSPNHSVVFSLKSASASTICLMSKIDSVVAPMKDILASVSSQRTTLTSAASSAIVNKSSGSVNSLCHISATPSEDYEPAGPKSTNPSIVEIDWLTLFVPYRRRIYPINAAVADNFPSSDGNWETGCNVSQIAEPSACPSAQVIQITDLDVGKIMRLKKTDTDEVEVVFVYEGRQDIGVRLTSNLPLR